VLLGYDITCTLELIFCFDALGAHVVLLRTEFLNILQASLLLLLGILLELEESILFEPQGLIELRSIGSELVQLLLN